VQARRIEERWAPARGEGSVLAALERGRAAWPGVSLSARSFLAHVARVDATDGELSRYGADLVLACACSAADEQAVGYLEREILSDVVPALFGMGLASGDVEEVLQRARVLLLTRPSLQIAGYAGRGPLVGWVRTAVTRVALRFLRQRANGPRPLSDGVMERLVASGADPVVTATRDRFRGDFQCALEESLTALTTRAKEVLRLHYLERQSIDEIGRVYGVHRATVARWLGTIRSTLLANVRSRLGRELHPSSADFRSLAAAVQEELHVSIDRLLGRPAAASPADQ
jgi:RNA polymerase sigma-70 factor, ECF subfamily